LFVAVVGALGAFDGAYIVAFMGAFVGAVVVAFVGATSSQMMNIMALAAQGRAMHDERQNCYSE
jgi:hypothetical protein